MVGLARGPASPAPPRESREGIPANSRTPLRSSVSQSVSQWGSREVLKPQVSGTVAMLRKDACTRIGRTLHTRTCLHVPRRRATSPVSNHSLRLPARVKGQRQDNRIRVILRAPSGGGPSPAHAVVPGDPPARPLSGRTHPCIVPEQSARDSTFRLAGRTAAPIRKTASATGCTCSHSVENQCRRGTTSNSDRTSTARPCPTCKPRRRRRTARAWSPYCRDIRLAYKCPRRSQAEHHWRARDVAGDQRGKWCSDVTG